MTRFASISRCYHGTASWRSRKSRRKSRASEPHLGTPAPACLPSRLQGAPDLDDMSVRPSTSRASVCRVHPIRAWLFAQLERIPSISISLGAPNGPRSVWPIQVQTVQAIGMQSHAHAQSALRASPPFRRHCPVSIGPRMLRCFLGGTQGANGRPPDHQCFALEQDRAPAMTVFCTSVQRLASERSPRN